MRAAALLLLDEEPRNGYQLIQDIAERSNGAWRPSPGSIYPALAQLQDEGLIAEGQADGRRTFALTETGRAHVRDRREELAAVFDGLDEPVDEAAVELQSLLAQLGAAVGQVAQAGTEEHLAAARQLLVQTRRALYRLLADDAPQEEK